MSANTALPTNASAKDGVPRVAPGAREDIAAVLARFACGLSLDDLSPSVIAATKVNVFDTLVCAIAGSGARGVAEARDLAIEWAGAPQATIFAFGNRVPAHHAAWVNGTMAHARDYDDTHDAVILHAGVSVIPAALAAAELRFGARGDDFIVGVAAGLETICRLGIATRIGIIESGFSFTPLFGHFAATVAAGRVLGLTPSEMANALGIVYSQAAGNHQVSRDGALTKRMQPGFAAQAALVSTQLARRGVTGAQEPFDGVDGFVRVYLRDRFDRDALRKGLGEHYEFVELSYKPYPSCRFSHTAIDAALALRASAGLVAERISRIRVGVNQHAYQVAATPIDVRKAPGTIVQAQFSIPFTVAAALIDGRVDLGHFTEESIRRKDILSLAQRVDVSVDAEIEREWGRNVSPADLHIRTDTGSTHSLRVDWPLGHPRRPMSTTDFDAKAVDCFGASAVRLREEGPRQLRNLVDTLESIEDVRSLVDAVSLPS